MARRTRKFNYQQRSREQIETRQEGESLFDQPYKGNYTIFSPKPGSHSIRILPPTWDNAEHYGVDVYLHSSVGTDNQTYLCLNKNEGGPGGCPVCKEYDNLRRLGEEKAADEIRPYRRVLCWILNLGGEEPEKPVLFPMPVTIDRELAIRSQVKRTGEILCIDHPEEGYDVEFKKSGTGLNTKYEGVDISRVSTPISDDDAVFDSVMDFILDHPLPSVLNFYDADYVANVLGGQVASSSPSSRSFDDEEEETPVRSQRSRRAVVEEPEDEEEEVEVSASQPLDDAPNADRDMADIGWTCTVAFDVGDEDGEIVSRDGDSVVVKFSDGGEEEVAIEECSNFQPPKKAKPAEEEKPVRRRRVAVKEDQPEEEDDSPKGRVRRRIAEAK